MPFTAAPFHLNGLTIQPGERVLTRLVVSRLPSGTLIDVPVHVLRGPAPGPVLLLMEVASLPFPFSIFTGS